MVDDKGAPLPAPVICGLCGHPWAVHVGGGPTAVWVSCCAEPEPPAAAEVSAAPRVAGLGGPAVPCYCRRAVAEFRAEALAAAGRPGDGGEAAVACVTCGEAAAEDTQCRGCRRERQRLTRERFTARQAALAREARRRASRGQ